MLFGLPYPRGRRGLSVGWADAIAILLVLATLVFLAETSPGLIRPLNELAQSPVSLDPLNLPYYAARTTLRMLVALTLSLLFTFTYATAAAKSRRASIILLPLLDILQSVPILGFISITVVFFMALAPDLVLGAEFAAVFAIFTSQAWNMAFSFYQSLRTVPTELTEASRSFLLTPWTRFWRLEVPFAMPPLIWNMMMSMSGGWFFVVASEAISVGNTTVTLPGMGSYIALAIENRDASAIAWAIGTMFVVILLYDQLLFRPLIAWSDRFRFEQEQGALAPRSLVLDTMMRSRILRWAARPFAGAIRWSLRGSAATKSTGRDKRPGTHTDSLAINLAFYAMLGGAAAWAITKIAGYVLGTLSWSDVGTAAVLSFATLARVVVLIALASLIWVPIGIWIGLRPRAARIVQPIAQFLAAFPANLLFPIAVSAIVAWHLSPNIWLSPLMILGTQWYILFNVIAGATAMPQELRDIAANFRLGGWLWWRKVALPGVMPFYLTGAITASGGSWNASIVAEMASWGDMTLEARGIGSYIAQATVHGNYPRIVLGIAMMSLFVIVLNRAFWRPLYSHAERKFRLSY